MADEGGGRLGERRRDRRAADLGPACLPLTFHVGTREQTVRFGFGKRFG